ncbi:hypothetical protein [uncultured Gilvimarinus sp.]|uniref:hypothetical protein n=1 Tax=uncultured Gilvimarinus sp. TaxID=1689143 RepID=UPI0030ECCBEE|tara:strand:+ start:3184 stop:3468 length:285 start_codon:yes stop_codon:yes gene_type:complete
MRKFLPYRTITTQRFTALLWIARALLYLSVILGVVGIVFFLLALGADFNIIPPYVNIVLFTSLALSLYFLSAFIAFCVAVEDNTRRTAENTQAQ